MINSEQTPETYLIQKINEAPIIDLPFKHVYIENFLSDEHFKLFVENPLINLPAFKNTKDLTTGLLDAGYQTIAFPGCSTDIEKYIKDYELGFPNSNATTETYGIAFKLNNVFLTELTRSLINFFKSDIFHLCLRNKFLLKGDTSIKSGIQKYLSGYEISPHPDNRNKALTYLININTSSESESMKMHTQLLSFKQEYEYVKRFWENNLDKERGWVPWDWCESIKTINKNNSLIAFSPHNDTLHAVKLDYDHCRFQRTQIYGNLWFKDSKNYENVPNMDIPREF